MIKWRDEANANGDGEGTNENDCNVNRSTPRVIIRARAIVRTTQSMEQDGLYRAEVVGENKNVIVSIS